IQVHARLTEAIHLDAATIVVTDHADVFRVQSQLRSSSNGARDLSAGTDDFLSERDLAAVFRKTRHDQQRVGGVQTHAYQIESHLRKSSTASTRGPLSRTRLMTSVM